MAVTDRVKKIVDAAVEAVGMSEEEARQHMASAADGAMNEYDYFEWEKQIEAVVANLKQGEKSLWGTANYWLRKN